MHAALAATLATPCESTALGTEIDPIRIALFVDGMQTRGSGYDATELHALGVDGLTAVLDHLLPDTASAPRTTPAGPPEEVIRALLARLDADDFRAREQATDELIVRARGSRPLIEEAARSDSLEVRLRAERVLSSWESRPAARLSAYLSGFWAYIEGINDPPRLERLAERTLKILESGAPEGDRLHLARLCIAGVAHGREAASCNFLRPLVRHADVKIATLVTETVGAYKADPRFMPDLLVDALHSQSPPVVEAALRFVLGCQDEARREPVRFALRSIYEQGPEPLKFQACLPLMRDFHDADAWAYVVEQTASSDANRVRTAFNWIGDTKNSGRPPAATLVVRLDGNLAQRGEQRRAAVQALGAFAGEPVIARLIPLLTDADESVARQASASLLAQPDLNLVRQLLDQASAATANDILRSRARSLLAKIQQS